jgi:hypothetical protein
MIGAFRSAGADDPCAVLIQFAHDPIKYLQNKGHYRKRLGGFSRDVSIGESLFENGNL